MEEKSYYGAILGRKLPRSPPSKRVGRKQTSVLVVIAVGIAALLMLLAIPSGMDQPQRSRTLATFTLPIMLVAQHHDTAMPCNPCGPPPGAHASNDAKGPDNIYGNGNDCPHCSAYCAPGSIAMIAAYRGMPLVNTQQDDIYDAGKTMNGEIPLNKNLETHGVGMFHGAGGTAPEVQTSMIWAFLGSLITQHNQSDGTAMTAAMLNQYIYNSHPVLWLDNGGWPKNESPFYPPDAYRPNQGHAKVIGGYDDNGTADFSDDVYLIYDPWPEYNDMGILPVNATKGPGGTFDPYWLPAKDVNLSDLLDVYLVDTFPDAPIPEFGTVLIPVIGAVLLAIIMTRRRQRHHGPEKGA